MGGNVKFDTVVIGCGIAGFTVACSLAQRGKRVAIIQKGPGSTALSSGAWDFVEIPRKGPFGFRELQRSGRWAACLSRVLLKAPGLLDFDDVEATCRELHYAMGKTLPLQFSFSQAYCLPTSLGHWKHTFGAQSLNCEANRINLVGKKVGLVASDNWRFQPQLVAKFLVEQAKQDGIKVDIAPCYIKLHSPSRDWPLSHVACRMLNDENYRNDFQQAVLESLKFAGYDFLLFPPIFLNTDMAKSMERAWRVPIGEMLSTLEPIAGQRLTLAIEQTLKRLGIPCYRCEGLTLKKSDKMIESVSVRLESGDTLQAEGAQFILATGKHLGGGVRLTYTTVNEPLLDLPIYYSSESGPITYRSLLPWENGKFHAEQPWASLGVWVNEQYQPIGQTGNVVFDNLRACGSIIGGIDFARHGMGLGFMAYTGRQCALSLS